MSASHQALSQLADGVRYERGGVTARARECFEEIAAHPEVNPAAAAEALWRLANLHRLHSAWAEALDAARMSVDLARSHGLDDTEANALNIEGAVWWQRGDVVRARGLFTRMLDLARTPSTRAKALQNLGSLAAEERKFEEGERLLDESRTQYRNAGDARGEAVTLLNLGRLKSEQGFPEEARSILESAVLETRQTGDLEMHAGAVLNLGIALGALGLVSEAEDRITTAYGQFTIADIPLQRVRCLMELAELAHGREDPGGARLCLDHARDVAAAAGLPRELRLIDEQLRTLPPSSL